MTVTELRQLVRGLVPLFQAIQTRLVAVETKAATPGPAGLNGRDGLPGVPGPIGEKGADGTNGTNGRDGFSVDDLDVVFDQSKGWTLQLKNGDRTIERPLPFPYDAGVWDAAKTYHKGAGTTVNGAWWICQQTTKSRPGDGSPESSKAWRLAVKGGKDGKPGPQGPAGKDGDA